MGKRTKGKCKYCGKEYTFSYMNRHLPICKNVRKSGAKKRAARNADILNWLFIRNIIEITGYLWK